MFNSMYRRLIVLHYYHIMRGNGTIYRTVNFCQTHMNFIDCKDLEGEGKYFDIISIRENISGNKIYISILKHCILLFVTCYSCLSSQSSKISDRNTNSVYNRISHTA